MGEDKYSQEFEVNFHTPVEGAYYGNLINDLEFKNQINDSVIRDDICKTFVSWDLGMGDSTAIFVAQSAGQEIHIIDFLENHGQGLDYYINWLRDNRYDTAEQLLPHDIQVRELGTGKSRLEFLEEAGLNCRVVPKLNVDDGIQAVRRILPRCWFHTKVKDAVDLLRNYRRQYDEKRDVFFDKPVHDFTSHAADSFRYLAVGLNETDDGWNKPLEINKQWIV
jgi:phage terminase large subunit